MSKADLLRQAENADRHADQATDEDVKEALRRAAEQYRRPFSSHAPTRWLSCSARSNIVWLRCSSFLSPVPRVRIARLVPCQKPTERR